MMGDRVSASQAEPIVPNADSFGLVRGLRVEVAERQFRCGECCRMRRSGSLKVWVPDGVMRGDPDWSIEERTHDLLRYGHASATAWCLSCAPKKPIRPVIVDAAKPIRSLLSRLFGKSERAGA